MGRETSFEGMAIGISVTADLPYGRLYEISRMALPAMSLSNGIERGSRSGCRRMENRESIQLRGKRRERNGDGETRREGERTNPTDSRKPPMDVDGRGNIVQK